MMIYHHFYRLIEMTASEYREALAKYKVDPANTEKNRLENIQPFLHMLDTVEKSSIALFDMAKMEYAFLTSNFKYLLGIPNSDASAKSPLTKRELEILGLVSSGYPGKEIADFLGISTATVNNHRQNILTKMGAASSAEAVNYAKNLGLMNR